MARAISCQGLPGSWPSRTITWGSQSATSSVQSDLSSQAADGSTTAKVAMGLLHDTDCRVLFRQSTTEVAQAAELLQLTEAEAELLPKLGKGRALWKVGQHTAVVRKNPMKLLLIVAEMA